MLISVQIEGFGRDREFSINPVPAERRPNYSVVVDAIPRFAK